MNEPPCIEVGIECVGRDDLGCFWDPSVSTGPVARFLALRDHHGPGPGRIAGMTMPRKVRLDV